LVRHRPDVGLEAREQMRAEPAAAVFGCHSDVRAPAILTPAEHAAVGGRRCRHDRTGTVLRDEDEPVRLGVGRLEATRELDGLRASRAREAILELDEPIEVGGGALAHRKAGDHARSLGAVRRCA